MHACNIQIIQIQSNDKKIYNRRTDFFQFMWDILGVYLI